MKTFEESHKSKKNVGSMMENRKEGKSNKKRGKGGGVQKSEHGLIMLNSSFHFNTYLS